MRYPFGQLQEVGSQGASAGPNPKAVDRDTDPQGCRVPRAPSKCLDGQCGWSDRMNVRQAREPETMRCSSPHDLTDTRACRPIIPHPRRRHRPQPSMPTTCPGQRAGQQRRGGGGRRPQRDRDSPSGPPTRPGRFWPRWTTMTAPCSPNAKSTARRVKCPPSSRCWPAWTLPVSWSRPTRCTPSATAPATWSVAAPTTCWSSRPTSRNAGSRVATGSVLTRRR